MEDHPQIPGERRNNLLKSAQGDKTRGTGNQQDLNSAIVLCVFGYRIFYDISKITEIAN